MKYYSQNDEDGYIVEFFGNRSTPGRFLDIGAHDGKTFSNTLRLVELGWHGVCVEPSPIPFTNLMQLHKDRPQIKLVHAAVTPTEQAIFRPFWDCGGDGVSTTVESHVEKWTKGGTAKYQEFWTLLLPLAGIFGQFGTDFDFLNLDVESANIELFRAMPWSKLVRLSMVCAEHDNHYAEMEATLAPLGFKKIAFNGENIILTR